MDATEVTAGSEDGPILRKQLVEQTRHIRICSLSNDDLCGEVFTTGFVTGEEVQLICQSRSKGEKQEKLIHFCKEIQSRNDPNAKKASIVEINLKNHFQGLNMYCCSKGLTIITKNNALELMPFEFRSNIYNKGMTYQCDCTIEVTRITDFPAEAPVTVVFSEQVEYNKHFVVPVISNGQNVILRPKSKYTIKVTFTQAHTMYYSRIHTTFDNGHLSLNYSSNYQITEYYSPIRTLSYRPV